MYSVYLPKHMYIYTKCTSMYAVNATIKILPILTKVVILLAFSKISPEASTKTAKSTIFTEMTDGIWGNFMDSKDQ